MDWPYKLNFRQYKLNFTTKLDRSYKLNFITKLE